MTQARSARWQAPMAIVLICGCLIGVISFGVRAGFGLFLEPISSTLVWSRDIFALSLAIQNLLWGAAQPFTGMLADKYGSGRMLAIGGVVYAAGTFLMAYSTDPLMMHITAGGLVGLGTAAGSFTIVLAALTRIVPENKRSIVLGLGMAAGSAGQMLIVPLGQAFIALFDWQTALILLAFLAFLITPLALAVTGKSEHLGMGPAQSIPQALVEAFRHPSYIWLLAGFFVCGFHVAFIQVHLPAYLKDNGLPGWLGATSLALVGGFNIIGSFASGWVGSRWSKKYALSAIYFARSLTMVALLVVPLSVTSVLIFSATMGLLWLSTVPLTSGLVAQFFGVRYMATLFGFVFFSHQVGAFLGAWMGGKLYSLTGNYDLSWYVAIGLGIASALAHFPIREAPVARLANA